MGYLMQTQFSYALRKYIKLMKLSGDYILDDGTITLWIKISC